MKNTSRLEVGQLDATIRTSGIKLVEPFSYITEITDKGVKIGHFFLEAWASRVELYRKWFPDPIYRVKIKPEPKFIECDTLILTTMRVQQIELYKEVKAIWKRGEIPGLKGVYLTGEAISPRTYFELQYPMVWTHKLGKEI